MEICDSGALALAAAVIAQAVKDWYVCQEAILMGHNYLYAEGDANMAGRPRERQKIIEDFFRSGWFHTLSDLDGGDLVDIMRAGPCIRIRGTSSFEELHNGKPRLSRAWTRLGSHPALQERLRAAGVSQRAMARGLGVNYSVLDKWMRAGISDEQAARITDALDRMLMR